MSRAGRVLQPAGYNPIHACRPPAEQEETSRVCSSLSALYRCGFLSMIAFWSDPAICRAGGLCCCHRYSNTAAATVRFLWAAECGRECQPLLRCMLFSTSVSVTHDPTTVLLCSVRRVCVRCMPFNLFFCRQSLVLYGRGLIRRLPLCAGASCSKLFCRTCVVNFNLACWPRQTQSQA